MNHPIKKRILGLLGLFFSSMVWVSAQEVPSLVELGDLKIRLDSRARQAVQNRVNILKENSGAFRKKIQTANLYFPLIEDVLRENKIPTDFKYLALLDNTSLDSLHFWQMAGTAAQEWGLKINRQMDERENVVAVTRQIAQFLKKNQGDLKNWLFTLLTYHLKLDGVKDYVKKSALPFDLGNLLPLKEIAIPAQIHPDILQFLAYKVAFQDELANLPQKYELVAYNGGNNRTLNEIAQEFALKPQEVKNFNHWLKTERVPLDKPYDVIIPMPAESPSRETPKFQAGAKIATTEAEDEESFFHLVERGETLYSIARLYAISVKELFAWNGLNNNSKIQIGQRLVIAGGNTAVKTIPVETGKAQTTSTTATTTATQTVLHTVARSEGLFSIARRYSVSVAEIRTWNSLSNDLIHPGQKLKIQVKKNADSKGDSPIIINPPPTDSKSPEPAKNNSGVRSIGLKSVPAELEFGGIKLKITLAAQALIKKDVDLLIKNAQYFFVKLSRVDMYSPLVEEVLQAENTPLDFRYLPIQESTYIANAISRSNAVGYWQFKEPSAKEMGLFINPNVDERMHIVSSTQAAAKYLKRNQLYFQNWVIALLSYNMGFTGAKNFVAANYPNQDLKGVKEMEINENTHWYIRKFLAHKIAFEAEIGVDKPIRRLSPYAQTKAKTLAEIAQAAGSNSKEMLPHNLWLKRTRVPEDKPYTAIVTLKP
ncbi:MAG: LysM peptidoglycan-binding domain-containing protein [Microscillaceae bacterium]|nr:LysM peptidoglycan-binding domain-containing protein [Microscillaceae bacterium]